ncbi:sucrase-isomaltase, intestinal-like [Glandiceps talaboti]
MKRKKGTKSKLNLKPRTSELSYLSEPEPTYTDRGHRQETDTNRLLLICLCVGLLAVIVNVVVGVYYMTSQRGKVNDSANGGQCATDDIAKFDCFPEGNVNEELCETRGCCWQLSETKVPSCYYPSYYGYQMVGDPETTSSGQRLSLRRIQTPSLYGNDIENVLLIIEMQTDSRLHFKFIDADNVNDRYEVPLPMPESEMKSKNPLYSVSYKKSPFSVKITRQSTGTTILDSSVGALVLADQFLQISYMLPSKNVYGLGEHIHGRYQHDMEWKTWPMFALGDPPNTEKNLYSHHPFYMVVEEDGNSHGVFLLNSNAMEVTLQPTPALTWRTIGGILDFWMFLGPTPEAVLRQYHSAIGKPAMPSYWSLGFHLCRWDYKDMKTLTSVVERTRRSGIPYDVQWLDIDYMKDKLDFTYDKDTFEGLPEFVKDLHNHGQKVVIILDPGIASTLPHGEYPPFDDGKSLGVYVNHSDGKTPIEGEVWPGVTVFPDYTNPVTEQWWKTWCKNSYNILPYDGLWIDMNEPALRDKAKKGVICEKNRWNNPPYVPSLKYDNLYARTLCMDCLQKGGRHYDLHSLYGHTMGNVTRRVLGDILPGKRSLILSRSTYAGSGQYVAHWLGDNESTWKDMHNSIPGILEFNLFGIPMVGADVCGFLKDTTAEMCQRWMQLAAFYPFSRNHNYRRSKAQDPGEFSVAWQMAVAKAMTTRYYLLPYLYTLFYHAHTRGGTVVRPLLHEFPNDQNTWSIDKQFLWGPSLMICPVLQQGVDQIDIYFPDDKWYDFYTGTPISDQWRSHYATVSAPLDHINLFLRAGSIIPLQQPANTTVYSRLNTMELIVAMPTSDSILATGSLFWDDGESTDSIGHTDIYIEFEATQELIGLKVIRNNYFESGLPYIGKVTIFGARSRPKSVDIDEKSLEKLRMEYDDIKSVLHLSGFLLPINQNHIISLTY